MRDQVAELLQQVSVSSDGRRGSRNLKIDFVSEKLYRSIGKHTVNTTGMKTGRSPNAATNSTLVMALGHRVRCVLEVSLIVVGMQLPRGIVVVQSHSQHGLRHVEYSGSRRGSLFIGHVHECGSPGVEIKLTWRIEPDMLLKVL